VRQQPVLRRQAPLTASRIGGCRRQPTNDIDLAGQELVEEALVAAAELALRAGDPLGKLTEQALESNQDGGLKAGQGLGAGCLGHGVTASGQSVCQFTRIIV
jgi:hypothetical protein